MDRPRLVHHTKKSETVSLTGLAVRGVFAVMWTRIHVPPLNTALSL